MRKRKRADGRELIDRYFIFNHKFKAKAGSHRIEVNCLPALELWGRSVSTRDWVEIENELNSLVPGLPGGDRKMLRNHEDRQAIGTDEQALLAHIAAALVQEKYR